MNLRNQPKTSKNFQTYSKYIYSIIIIGAVLLWFSGCSLLGSGSQAAEPETGENQQPAEVSPPTGPDTEQQDQQAVSQAVEQFGLKLAEVSLTAPPDILETQMRESYSGLVSEDLINEWIENPLQALGRLTSSPWPDKIEIDKVEKINEDTYRVTGRVLEVTSVEADQGTYSGSYEVDLTLARSKEQWLITDAAKGTYQGQNNSEAIKAEFDQMEKSVENISRLFEFVDNHKADASPQLVTEMLAAVIDLCQQYLPEMATKFYEPQVQETIYELSPSLEDIDLEILAGSYLDSLSQAASEAMEKKYKLIAVEGSFEPIIDYQAYLTYSPFLTGEMNDYINLKAMESNSPALLDAGIAVDNAEYVQRILKSMEYLEKYSDSPRKEEVKQYAIARMSIYLRGIDNSPVFDFSRKIIPDKLQQFESDLQEYAGTDFAIILADYLNLLQQEDYTRTQAVDDFVNNIGHYFQ